jgi:hypothetical protein
VGIEVIFQKSNWYLTRTLVVAFFWIFGCAVAIARSITFIPQTYDFDRQGYEFSPDARYGITLSCVDSAGIPTSPPNGNTQYQKIYEPLSFEGLPSDSACKFLLIPPTVPAGLAGAFNPPANQQLVIDPSETVVYIGIELYLPKRVSVTLVMDVPSELAALAISANLTWYAFAIDVVRVESSSLVNGSSLALESIPKNAACSLNVDRSAIEQALLNSPYVLTSLFSTLPSMLSQDTEATVTIKIEKSVQVRVSTVASNAVKNLVSDISITCSNADVPVQTVVFYKSIPAHSVGNELVFYGVPPGFYCRVDGSRPTIAVPGFALLESAISHFKSPEVFDASFIVGLFYRYVTARPLTISNSVDGAPPSGDLGSVQLSGFCSPSEPFKSDFLLNGSSSSSLTTTDSFPVGASCTLRRVSYTATPPGYVWKLLPSSPTTSFFGTPLLKINEVSTNTASLVHTLVAANSTVEIELDVPTPLNLDISSLRANATCNASDFYSSTNVFFSGPAQQLQQGRYLLKISNLPPNIRCEIGFPGMPEPPSGYFASVVLPQRTGINIGFEKIVLTGNLVLYENTVAKIAFEVSGLPSALSVWSIEGTIFCGVNDVRVYSQNVRVTSLRPDIFAGDIPLGGQCVFVPSESCCSIPSGYALRRAENMLANVTPGTSFSNLVFRVEFSAESDTPSPLPIAVAVPALNEFSVVALCGLLLGLSCRRLLKPSQLPTSDLNS